MKPIESSLLPVCWRMISLWLKIWKLGRYFFQLKLLLHHFAALQRELKWFPKVYRISCHWSLAIPSRLNPVLLLQMDCSLHSSWLPTLISFVLLQLVGAPTIYYLVYEVLNAAIRLPLNHYGYDLMIWRTWLLKSFYEELLCFCHRFVHVIKLSFVGILHLLGHLPHFVKVDLESDHCSFLWTRHSTQNKIQFFWKALALNTQRRFVFLKVCYFVSMAWKFLYGCWLLGQLGRLMGCFNIEKERKKERKTQILQISILPIPINTRNANKLVIIPLKTN